MGKEKLLPVCAIVVLLIGCFSTLYVYASQVDSNNVIKIGNKEYTINQIFSLANTRTIITNEGEKTGIALDDLIIQTYGECLSCDDYTFKAKDGYQQTVNWDYLKKGVLTRETCIYFSDTASSFWVKNIVEIEVS
jgi:hypothetical protein